MTVAEVVTLLKAAVPDMPQAGFLGGSSDTLKAGNENTEVTGIVTTFLATAEVIEKTAELGANLILTHEPTFYHHDDTPATFPEDAVIRQKLRGSELTGLPSFVTTTFGTGTNLTASIPASFVSWAGRHIWNGGLTASSPYPPPHSEILSVRSRRSLQ